MVPTVRQLCVPHQAAFAYVVGDQIEKLDQVLADTAVEADDFFAKNHVTAGLRVLLQEGLSRLAGRSGQAVYELRQAMGGGKTHSMIALGLLARSASLRKKIVPEIANGSAFGDAKVVAVNGRSVERDRYVWGEIITQLGKAGEGARFWNQGPKPPTQAEWIALIGKEPTLILLDELPPYLDYAGAVPAGEKNLATLAKFALSNLFAAALDLPRCCIVMSSLTSTYQNASAELHDLANEAARSARPLTPVDLGTDEIYSILRRRLFASMPSNEKINEVATAYRSVIAQAVTAQAIPSTARQLADEIAQTYPFHPSVKHIIGLFRNNETFRQTRGLMQIASRMLLSVWHRPTDDVALIGCQHLDLSLQEVRDDINRIKDLQSAIAHDVFDSGQSVAEHIDRGLGGVAARESSAMLLTASLSSAVDAVQGFTEDQLIEYLISPSTDARAYRDAFKLLRDESWYLHRNKSDAWYFSPAENLRKLIEDRARNAPQPKIEEDMRRRLREAFKPRGAGVYDRIEALPRINELDLRGGRLCAVLQPEPQQPTDALKRFYDAAVEKNNLCVVTGDGSKFADLETAVRRAYGTALARDQMAHSQPDKVREAEDLASEAEQNVNSTIIGLFNKVIYPTRDGLTVAALQVSQAGAEGQGERDVATALSGTGALKLLRDLDTEADRLILRAEDMLWPANDRKTRWADVEERARTNPRWPWIEPKGLARLREKAKGQGRWRDNNDGWIEKGPFPKDKTQVYLIPEYFNDRTGEATINVRAVHAGKSPQIYYKDSADVSAANGTLLAGEVHKTNATALWFVAVDSDGQHETGPATPWRNQLSLTHDVQTLSDGRRRVTLAVQPDITQRPGGVLKWNTKGINPKDGENYVNEIIIAVPSETKLWAYAEHMGAEATRTFVIPAANADGVAIDYDLPATLNRRQGFTDTASTFKVLKFVKDRQVKLGLAKLTVGTGEEHVQLRFGQSVILGSDVLERMVTVAREALSNEQAEVAVDISEMRFETGRDLEDYLKDQGLDARPEEIEQ